MTTITYLRSVDPRELCVGIKYYIVHMYSMPYYTIYIYIKNGSVMRIYAVLEIL